LTPWERKHEHWWLSDSLQAPGRGGLELDGRSIADLADRRGTPVYAYSLNTVRACVAELRAALATLQSPSRIFYAIKANRFRPVVDVVLGTGDVGIDASSPRESALALEIGVDPSDISVTASMLSNRDLEAFAEQGVHLNLDSVSALHRYGERVARGTKVGLRLDPGIEVGYGSDPKLAYGNTKFGFYPDHIESAVAAAEQSGLVVDTLHIHCGWGLQMLAVPKLDWAFDMLAKLARRFPSVEIINVGGGLGNRRSATDDPLVPGPWAECIERRLDGLGLTVACEPGTWIVDRAGVLVVEVNTVEEKWGTIWVGVDAGHNVIVNAAHYGLPIEVVHVARPLDPPKIEYSVAGNINEANDVFVEDVLLPEVHEGDLLALLPAGAYGSSMASDHCLRGFADEVAV